MYTLKIETDIHGDIESPFEYETEMVLISNHRDYNSCNNDGVELDDFESIDELKEHFKDYNCYPVNAYIHSGIALSLGSGYPFDCQWDSGLFGILLVKKSAEIPDKSVESFVEYYGQYLNGEVYGYVITDSEGEDIDSCWGYIGYENVESEGNAALKWHIADAKLKRVEKLKAWIKNKVPLHLRLTGSIA